MSTNEQSRVPISAMTAREQVCLQLRVPQSGTTWLDDLIEKALYMEWRRVQWEGLCRNPVPSEHRVYDALDEVAEVLRFRNIPDAEDRKSTRLNSSH